MTKLRVVSLGLGPIGLRAAALVASKSTLDLAGAIDVAPALAGRDLGELTGSDAATGLVVSDDAGAVLAETAPDAVIHCTSSFLRSVADQLVAVISSGANVVSSTEELLWPRLQHPEIADRLDGAARAAGVTVLGTGVNPGFVMDTLPAFASAALYDARHVHCRRWVDATTRRLPFQKKIGAGLTPDEFRRLVAEGRLGHVGLRESIALLGAAVGFDLDRIEQSVEPVLATRRVETEHFAVPEGRVSGILNTGWGRAGTETKIEMDLRMYIGCEEPGDEVILDGTPGLHLRIEGGTSGDLATAAMLVNSVPGVVAAAPGLATMLEVPIPHLVV